MDGMGRMASASLCFPGTISINPCLGSSFQFVLPFPESAIVLGARIHVRMDGIDDTAPLKQLFPWHPGDPD